MSEELRKCPFCGSEEVLEIGPDTPGRDIYCATCEATVYWSNARKNKAPKHWNRRSPASERMARPEAVEIVAAECHKQWAGWTKYLLGKMSPLEETTPDLYLVIEKVWAERWRKQIDTPYAELTEAEKESDRIEARKILTALDAQDQGNP